MPRATKTLPQFQEFVWSQLPERQRERAGKERIYDLVAAAVQEWPDDQLSQAEEGSPAELAALEGLKKNVTRHLRLMYGDKVDEGEYGMIWIILLQILLPIVVQKILEWWRKRKENQGRIRIWRRKWVNGPES